jgi:hypothetical protein
MLIKERLTQYEQSSNWRDSSLLNLEDTTSAAITAHQYTME